MRYIDADKAMDEINRIGGHNLCEWETIGVKALIDRQPTADVVEVVRCCTCKYSEAVGDIGCHCQNRKTPWFNDEFEVYMNLDDFCSYGRRE